MKKKSLLVIIFLFSFIHILNVNAKDNKLYFSEWGNHLYYDSAKFDNNTFIYHEGMEPGITYEDKLIIENNTQKSYPLYLTIQDKIRTNKEQELLDNIIIEIYLNDKIVYTGYADGLDYIQNKQLIKNSLYLGIYESKSTQTIIVKSTLDNQYTNKNNNTLANINWVFQTMYDDSITVINPKTGDKFIIYAIGLFIMSFIIMVITFFMVNSKKREQKEL